MLDIWSDVQESFFVLVTFYLAVFHKGAVFVMGDGQS